MLSCRTPVADQEQVQTEKAEKSIEDYVELAKRAFALKQYETAIENYATALELS